MSELRSVSVCVCALQPLIPDHLVLCLLRLCLTATTTATADLLLQRLHLRRQLTYALLTTTTFRHTPTPGGVKCERRSNTVMVCA